VQVATTVRDEAWFSVTLSYTRSVEPQIAKPRQRQRRVVGRVHRVPPCCSASDLTKTQLTADARKLWVVPVVVSQIVAW